MESNQRIAVIGLGYVGLPLAVEFARKYQVVGFDTNRSRIEELMGGRDHTMEIEDEELRKVLHKNDGSPGLICSEKTEDIQSCNYYIITVPTPTDKNNFPDLTLLLNASATVGKVLKKGDIVIYESTVYPGATEEKCIPVLEKISGLVFNKDFFCGYSPERLNPGDKVHRISKIIKITAGSTPAIAEKVDALYRSVIDAGTHMAPSIKVAEAAKLVENSQRDINVAFMNELAKIFNLLGIDTKAVLEAASTKWNFLKFRPGLVGGHCIGAAPYFLARKSGEAGYNPEIILAGRKINDGMGTYVAGESIKLMVKKNIPVKHAEILILGFTFKEDCPDARNTRVVDIVNELKSYQAKVSIWDPWADPDKVKQEYGIELMKSISPDGEKFDAVILAVAHREFDHFDIRAFLKKNSVVYDVKSVLSADMVDGRL
jgi:UDP-N-acetyl-D-galactosamine dehydrogenase